METAESTQSANPVDCLLNPAGTLYIECPSTDDLLDPDTDPDTDSDTTELDTIPGNPQNYPDQLNQLNQLNSSGLSPEHATQLASYIGLKSLFDALSNSSWDYDRQIAEVVSCASQSENLSVKLQALKYINQLIIDSARMSGYLVSATRTSRGSDGTLVTLSADIVASALDHTPITKDTPKDTPKEKPKELINPNTMKGISNGNSTEQTKPTNHSDQPSEDPESSDFKESKESPESPESPETSETSESPEGSDSGDGSKGGPPADNPDADHRPPTRKAGQIVFPGLAVPDASTRPPTGASYSNK